MSGASGKVPAAIHLTPEALGGGLIGKIIDGDMVLLDAEQGLLEVEVAAEVLAARPAFVPDARLVQGLGRELFAGFRAAALPADRGGGFFSPI